jgi:alpha-beta hydrolase superfamily lysophospholipase
MQPTAWDDRAVRRRRTITPVTPVEIGNEDGLAFSLWIPDGADPPQGGIVILHGAGSSKESHYDYARAALPLGFAALAFDQRGHGDSDGPMDARVIDDTAAMAAMLRRRLGQPAAPIALRGSSMGGCLAILAAPAAGAAAVVAICPASPEGLRRGLAANAFPFEADVRGLDALLASQDLFSAVESLEHPVLLLHAEGDEQVPVEHSRELATRLRDPESRLIAVPGGHHRSIQHDHELQAVSLRFISRAFERAGG